MAAAGEGQLLQQGIFEQQHARVLWHVTDDLHDRVRRRVACIQTAEAIHSSPLPLTDHHPPISRLEQPGQQLDQGRLAGAVAAHQRSDLAAAQR